MAVGAVHGLGSDCVAPWQLPIIRAESTTYARGASGCVHHRMPRAVVVALKRRRCARIRGRRRCALMRDWRLEFLGLVGVARVTAGRPPRYVRGRAGCSQLRTHVAAGVQVVVAIAVIRVALEADLVLAGHMCRGHAGISAGTRIAALDDVTGGQALERGATV